MKGAGHLEKGTRTCKWRKSEEREGKRKDERRAIFQQLFKPRRSRDCIDSHLAFIFFYICFSTCLFTLFLHVFFICFLHVFLMFFTCFFNVFFLFFLCFLHFF